MRHKDPFDPNDEFVHFIYATHAEIALAYLQSAFFAKLNQHGSEFKLVQSMVRMNTREFIRKSKKSNTWSDPRHAGMSFYIDLNDLFSKNYRDYWESQMLNMAFYEPDYKNLDNLVQTMN